MDAAANKDVRAASAIALAIVLGQAVAIELITGAFTPLLLPVLLLPLAVLLRYARRRAAESEHQALHDVLTGLPNRALFRDRVDRALTAARREGGRPVVMMLDLDRFKEINDSLGHHHGDEVLRQMGPRIAGVLRSSDT